MKQQQNHIGDANKMVTAVDWLVDQVENFDCMKIRLIISSDIIEKAKEMEKEHIIESYLEGADYNNSDYVTLAKEYYNQKYQNK